MNRETFRIALRAEEARGCLTDSQRSAVDAFLIAGSISGAARHLDISREAARKRLAFALRKLAAFAAEIERG